MHQHHGRVDSLAFFHCRRFTISVVLAAPGCSSTSCHASANWEGQLLPSRLLCVTCFMCSAVIQPPCCDESRSIYVMNHDLYRGTHLTMNHHTCRRRHRPPPPPASRPYTYTSLMITMHTPYHILSPSTPHAPLRRGSPLRDELLRVLPIATAALLSTGRLSRCPAAFGIRL